MQSNTATSSPARASLCKSFAQKPKGSLDFGRDIPHRDVSVIGPTVELLSREDLHPALCDPLRQMREP